MYVCMMYNILCVYMYNYIYTILKETNDLY